MKIALNWFLFYAIFKDHPDTRYNESPFSWQKFDIMNILTFFYISNPNNNHYIQFSPTFFPSSPHFYHKDHYHLKQQFLLHDSITLNLKY